MRRSRRPLLSSIQDIARIDGFLQEPSGFNDQGEPVALNFATGEPDTRQLRHPDGVILDIGTHVLAMLRETIRYCGGTDEMHLEVRQVSDRLGQPLPGEIRKPRKARPICRGNSAASRSISG